MSAIRELQSLQSIHQLSSRDFALLSSRQIFDYGGAISKFIVANDYGGFGFLSVGDFELRCTVKIDHGNSGIQYRSKQVQGEKLQNNWVVGGYQDEIENTPGKAGFLYHERGPGRGYPDKANYLCRVGDKVTVGEDGKSQLVTKIGENAELGKLYKKSDWNDYIIIARGNHIQHYINGYLMIDVTDNDPKNRMMEGILALQLHAGQPMVVEFKDLRLKQY